MLGPSWDMHSGLTLGEYFAFISCWFCWGLIPSIWVFQGGLGDIYIYIIFFPLLLLFCFQEDDGLCWGRESRAAPASHGLGSTAELVSTVHWGRM